MQKIKILIIAFLLLISYSEIKKVNYNAFLNYNKNLDTLSQEVLIENIIIKYQNTDLTIENLKSALKNINISRPDDVLLHILRESGNLKSKLSQKHNNITGMKFPTQRETYAIKKNKFNYAIYKHWIHSLLDYWIWQGKGNITIIGNYRTWLASRNYFPKESI